eukprot:1136208-Pelagomonas_calceolata.AAC.4
MRVWQISGSMQLQGTRAMLCKFPFHYAVAVRPLAGHQVSFLHRKETVSFVTKEKKRKVYASQKVVCIKERAST